MQRGLPVHQTGHGDGGQKRVVGGVVAGIGRNIAALPVSVFASSDDMVPVEKSKT
jgi:hypothetical protein